MLEAIKDVGTEALGEVGVFPVGDILDEDRGVEVYKRPFYAGPSVCSKIYWGEGPVGTVALANHWNSPPSTGVGIEPVGLLACIGVFYLYQIGSIHGVPTSIYVVRENGAFVAPLRKVLDGSRPHADIVAAVFRVVGVVRTNDVGTQLTWVVGVFKHTGFAIGNMLPEGEVRVLGLPKEGAERQDG